MLPSYVTVTVTIVSRKYANVLFMLKRFIIVKAIFAETYVGRFFIVCRIFEKNFCAHSNEFRVAFQLIFSFQLIFKHIYQTEII